MWNTGHFVEAKRSRLQKSRYSISFVSEKSKALEFWVSSMERCLALLPLMLWHFRAFVICSNLHEASKNNKYIIFHFIIRILESYKGLRNKSNGREKLVPCTSYSSSIRKYVLSTTSRQVCSRDFAAFGLGMLSTLLKKKQQSNKLKACNCTRLSCWFEFQCLRLYVSVVPSTYRN